MIRQMKLHFREWWWLWLILTVMASLFCTLAVLPDGPPTVNVSHICDQHQDYAIFAHPGDGPFAAVPTKKGC